MTDLCSSSSREADVFTRTAGQPVKICPGDRRAWEMPVIEWRSCRGQSGLGPWGKPDYDTESDEEREAAIFHRTGRVLHSTGRF